MFKANINTYDKSFDALWGKISKEMPDLSAISEDMETSELIPEEILKWFYDAKIFKLFVPFDFGGLMESLPIALRIYERLAYLDGNLGWLAQIGAGGGFFVPAFSFEVAKKFFSDPKAVIAGTGFPAGYAERLPGGYRVSGRWKYASGSQYATLFTASATVRGMKNNDGSEKIYAFAFPPDQVRILHDWDSFGLKATSSNTFIVEDLFVPEEHTFIVGEVQYDYGYPLYRFPFQFFAELSIASVSIGIARRFFDLLKETNCNEDLSTQYKQIDILKEKFFQTADKAWDETDKLDEEKTTLADNIAKKTAYEMRKAVLEIFPKLGMSVLREKHPLNRIFRDLETVCHHVSLQ
ncbi:acyl-CoA dehydrogenase [Bacillaceae bacterium Marseille-Q3522]|nr:acyl-CoA dehydrogenase [Bacillaceae bacterium Marseille-Q3522]